MTGTVKRKEQSPLKYLEIDALSHLLKQRREVSGEYIDSNWRESYYFNVTDPKKDLSLITTIATMPNRMRKRIGFVIVLYKGRIHVARFHAMGSIRWHEIDRFQIENLVYRVEGIDWRLRYKSKECDFDILFRPLHEYYSYIKEGEDAGIFGNLASQHIEQAGLFDGHLKLDGKDVKFGPCSGHRDHSWGLRDWSAIDNYWLLCCTFGNRKTLNIWKGYKGDKTFQRGYISRSGENREVVSSSIQAQYGVDGMEPQGAKVTFSDDKQRTHELECEVVSCVPIPMRKCIVYESIARMEYEGEVGYGLFEHLIHDTKPSHKVQVVRRLKKMSRRISLGIHR